MFFPKTRAFGLEIGHHVLRVALLRRGYFGTHIGGVAEVRLDRNPWLKTGLRDKEILSEKLKKIVTTTEPHPITINRVITALPESSVFSKVLVLPNVSNKELAQTIPFEAGESLPLPLEEMYLDWQIDRTVAHGNKHADIHVFLVAAPKKLVDETTEVIANAGFELVKIESQPFALARSVSTKLEPNKIEAIINIGRRLTTLTLATKEAIKLTATIPVGSEHLKNQFDQAIEDLVEEINEGINYYHNRIGDKGVIETGLLTGTGSTMPDLPEALSTSSGLRCSIGYPKVRLPGGDLIHPRFAAVLGLALGEE